MRLQPIPSPMVEANWGRVKHFIEAACRRGPLSASPEEFYRGLLARDYQLWIVEDECGQAMAGVITAIVEDVCEWSAVGGDGYAQWIHLETIIEDWARQNGCRAMRSFSRKGMVRRRPAYVVRGVILEKAL